jgi:hypothetical protein
MMGEDSQIQKMKAYRVQSVKELLAADLEKLILEIKPLSSMLSKLHSTNLLLNINCNWHYDGDLVDSLKDDEIEKLIKILMHYEKISFAGSVSAIPNLLRKLKMRDYKNLKDVVDWVIKFNNGDNPWIPTGFFKDQNLSTSEYLIKTL